MAAPLKAIMTGVELLLGRAQQWEVTAAKHVSLAAPLDTLLSLVGRWRKLELEGWRSLMKKIEQDVELAAKKVRLTQGQRPAAPATQAVCSTAAAEAAPAAFSEPVRPCFSPNVMLPMQAWFSLYELVIEGTLGWRPFDITTVIADLRAMFEVGWVADVGGR